MTLSINFVKEIALMYSKRVFEAHNGISIMFGDSEKFYSWFPGPGEIRLTQNSCTLTFEGITQGELVAIVNSLEARSDKSAICADLCNFVRREIRQSWPEVLE